MKQRKKPGPKPDPSGPRQRLNSREWVSGYTLKTLRLWRDVYGIPVGRSIDCLLAHCTRCPAFRLDVSKGRANRAKGLEALKGAQNTPQNDSLPQTGAEIPPEHQTP